jgi:histidinol dehydrogenase
VRLLRFGTPAWRRYLLGLRRGASPRPQVERAAAAVVRAVRHGGDAALVRFTARFDGVTLAPSRLRVAGGEVRALASRADPGLASALRAMARRIEAFHRRQEDRGFRMRFPDGSVLEEVVAPIESVGLYVPGGAASYPSSVL